MVNLRLSLRTAAACLLASAASLLLLTGCSSSFDPLAGTTPPLTTIGTLSGHLHGGQGPIIGASVYLYQVSNTAYGGASLQLAAPAVTNANGGFSITSYTTACTSGLPVYLYAVGGNTGSGTNSAAGLLAALGPCPATGTLAQAYPVVNMNEISTVAMAYATAGFATDATHIGYSGSALGLTGITNAFAVSQNIFNITSPYPTNTAPLQTGANTTNSTGTLPQALINTIADALAACVNSNGDANSPCNTTNGLFYYATSTGVAGGPAPTDTATAAIYIAQHPWSNATAIWGLDGGAGAPFQTQLTTAPADLTLCITYSLDTQELSYIAAHEFAIDAAGNAWLVSGNYLTTPFYKFTPLGVGTAYSTPAGFLSPIGIAIDNAADTGGTPTVYILDSYSAYVGRFSGDTGAFINDYKAASNGGAAPTDIAIDKAGNIWTANDSDETVGMQTPTGTKEAALYTSSNVTNPASVAADSLGYVYAGDYNSGNVARFTTTGSNVLFSSTGGGEGCYADAVDAANNIWCTGYFKLQSTSVTGIPGPGRTFTNGVIQNSLAIDGSGNVWTIGEDENYISGAIFESSNTAAALNGASGQAQPTAPGSVAIDGSGNVWYTINGSSTVQGVDRRRHPRRHASRLRRRPQPAGRPSLELRPTLRRRKLATPRKLRRRLVHAAAPTASGAPRPHPRDRTPTRRKHAKVFPPSV